MTPNDCFQPPVANGKAPCLSQLPELWVLHLPGELGYFWACPPPVPRSCPRWVWREGIGAKVCQGLQERGAGPRKPEGTGAASPPSSPALEEPRLVRNVNKEETALAKQRPRDNSRPKQSPRTPTRTRRQARPLCTLSNYHWQLPRPGSQAAGVAGTQGGAAGDSGLRGTVSAAQANSLGHHLSEEP